MVLKPEASLDGIANLIQQHVPDAEKTRLFGRELGFVLPRENVAAFPELFGQIETEIRQNSQLGIDSYGTSMPTLEEIFLGLGDEVISIEHFRFIFSLFMLSFSSSCTQFQLLFSYFCLISCVFSALFLTQVFCREIFLDLYMT